MVRLAVCASNNLAAIFFGWQGRSSDFDTCVLLGRRSSICYQSILHSPGNANKGIVDVNIVLGRTFKKWNAKLPGEFFTLFRGHDLFVQHIALVTHQQLVDVDISMLLDLGDPVANALKGAAVCHVIDEQNALSPAKVRGSDCSEAFLASRVPDLKLDPGSIDIHILDLKVDTNRRDKGRAERVVRVTEQEASLTDAGVSDHQQLDLNVVRCTSRSHNDKVLQRIE
jgi:hypothetical protein